jgi:hypothetical protein
LKKIYTKYTICPEKNKTSHSFIAPLPSHARGAAAAELVRVLNLAAVLPAPRTLGHRREGHANVRASDLGARARRARRRNLDDWAPLGHFAELKVCEVTRKPEPRATGHKEVIEAPREPNVGHGVGEIAAELDRDVHIEGERRWHPPRSAPGFKDPVCVRPQRKKLGPARRKTLVVPVRMCQVAAAGHRSAIFFFIIFF